jgi:hypothetical protein
VSWQGLGVHLHLWLLPSSRAILLTNDLPPLLPLYLVDGLSSEWISLPPNGGASTCLGLTHLHAQETGDRTTSGMGQAGRPRPISVRFGRPLAHVGPLVIMHFSPSICTILTMSSSRPRWRVFSHEVRSFTLQSSGMSLCNTSVLATLGSYFIMFSNTNGTPQLLL